MNLDTISALHPITASPDRAETRLIDSVTFSDEVSLAGFAERYGKGETSHTIHVWWARRPHSAMRALVFASLCKEVSEQASDILRQVTLFSDNSAPILSAPILSEAKDLLRSQYDAPPRLLDMFGGGGTIPLEACTLGAEAYTIDANQLSVFIQRCNLVYSQAAPSNIEAIVWASGTRVINQLAQESEVLFPLRSSTVYGYLWTYTMKCSSCGYRFYLSKRPWMSKKKGRNLALLIEDGAERQVVRIARAPDEYKACSAWSGRNGEVQCPRCGTQHIKVDIGNCLDEVVALIKPADGKGKEFLPVLTDVLSYAKVEEVEKSVLENLGIVIPQSELPCWSGIVNPAIYGVRTHADFLNRRQRVVLLLLVKALREEYVRLQEQESEATAKYVIGLLSSLIDQLVDWNCRLSMWISQNEQVGRAFCGPGVPMLWDYVETDPVLNGPANLWAKLNRIVSGAHSIGIFAHTAHVQHGYAQALPFQNNFFDAIVTDPPYYDNVFYSVLADFFYAWKRILLSSIDPDLFVSPVTDDSRELVASKFRSRTAAEAHESYCAQLTLALREAERVLKPDGVFCFLYSHSSIRGWEAALRAYRSTNLQITGVKPLNIERRQRPRAMTSKAVNTSLVIIARRSKIEKTCISVDNLISELRITFDDLASQLFAENWEDQDVALALFANGIRMLANVENVNGCSDDIEALRVVESIVQERVPSFAVVDRRSL